MGSTPSLRPSPLTPCYTRVNFSFFWIFSGTHSTSLYCHHVGEPSVHADTNQLTASLTAGMKTHLLATVLLTLSGVLPWDWGVKYPDNPICAVRGFTVSVPCYYYYPKIGFHVVQKLWCSMSSNIDQWCKFPSYVYNSSSNTKSDFMMVTDNQSDCTLLIHNVQLNYSGVYKFRFITNVTEGQYTGLTGVTLNVTDLKVSLIRLRGNGTLKQGDSLNLTCDVNCTHTSSQFVWSKNNQPLPEPGRVLHFPALTAKDSGKYTCTWKTNETLGSETISLQVEGIAGIADYWPVDAVVTTVVLLIILVILGAVIYSMRRKANAQKDNSGKSGVETQVKQLPQSNEEVPQQEELTYATVFIKNNHLNNGRVHSEKPKEDISVIYSTVKIK